VARCDIKLPQFFAGVRIERRHITTKRRELAAGIADEDFALRGARRHRDRVRGNLAWLGFGNRPRRPQHLAGSGVQRLKFPIQTADKYFVVVQRDAAAVDAATQTLSRVLPHRRIYWRLIAPDLFAVSSVDGVDDAPVGDAIKDAIRKQRIRFLAG